MKIICVGRNYAKHAEEFQNEIPKEPLLFLKPETAIIRNNLPFFYPDFSKEIHYETEIVVKINKLGKNIQEKFAHTYYQELGLGIDFTARDVQAECKKKGLPWEKAKAFDGSAVVSRFLQKTQFEDIQKIPFHLELNGKRVQQGNTSNMLFSIDRLITEISKFFTLKIGDFIFTGTPEGVGKVEIGDRMVGFLNNIEMFNVDIK